MACWKFIRVTSSGRHEYECQHCHHGFWFMPGTELTAGDPTWTTCPHCIGWRLLTPKERDTRS